MNEIAVVVTAVLGNIKTAAEIAKLLGSGDAGLGRAEAKLRLAELIGSLADAKMQLVEIQDAVREKETRIAELEEALEVKGSIRRQNDAIYLVNAAGEPEGFPHCLRCWEQDRRLRQLVHDAGDYRSRVCPACKTRYDGRLAAQILPPAT